VFCLSQDGDWTDFFNILGDRSLKLGLLIGTTFDPCYFSLDNTFNKTTKQCKSKLKCWMVSLLVLAKISVKCLSVRYVIACLSITDTVWNKNCLPAMKKVLPAARGGGGQFPAFLLFNCHDTCPSVIANLFSYYSKYPLATCCKCLTSVVNLCWVLLMISSVHVNW
jgi:hypothetical protein